MLSILDVFLIVGISQGLFTVVMIQFVPQRNKSANNILSLLILIACLMLLGRFSWGKFSLNSLQPLAILADTTIFLFGPLLYTYTRRISLQESTIFKLSKWHYIPAAIHIVYFVLYVLCPESLLLNLSQQNIIALISFIIELGGLISGLIYWIKSFRFLQKVKRLSPKQFSFEPFILRYLYFLLTPLLLCYIFWIVSIIKYFIPLNLPFSLDYNAIWIAIPFFFYVVGFFSFIRPSLLRVEHTPKPIKQEVKQRMNEALVLRNKDKLEDLMTKDKAFTNPELSLTLLANQLTISPNDLSWLLNTVYRKSFYTFINEYRVNEFVLRLKANEHHSKTILAIALDVGFNSKSTFNKFFKSVLHQTPSAYIKTLKLPQ